MDKLYYTVGEVAEILGENPTLVRFWANSFPKFIRPRRNAKGNRLFSKDDVECFRQIYFLVRVRGLTLEGAAKALSSERKEIENTMKVLEYLKSVRRQLAEVHKGL